MRIKFGVNYYRGSPWCIRAYRGSGHYFLRIGPLSFYATFPDGFCESCGNPVFWQQGHTRRGNKFWHARCAGGGEARP